MVMSLGMKGRRRRGRQQEEKPEDGRAGFRSLLNLSHIAEDGLVGSDGRRLSIYEMSGREFSMEAVGSFCRMLNTLDYTVQFMVRQHQPSMKEMRDRLRAERDEALSDDIVEAAESLDKMLGEFETREGMFDRRFYVVVAEEEQDKIFAELRGMNLTVLKLTGEILKEFVYSCVWGGSPRTLEAEDLDRRFELDVSFGEASDSEGRYRRAVTVRDWPRSISLGFVQRILALGIPMDISIHLSPFDSQSAASKLESQKIRMESSRNMALKRGQSVDPAVEIALEDVMRLRDAVQRGVERLFDVSMSLTLYAEDEAKLKEFTYLTTAQFSSMMGFVDTLKSRQLSGLRSVFPLNQNYLGEWSLLDTSSLGMLFPMNPPDLDHRTGTLFALDDRAGGPITFDIYKDFPNHNVAVLATSGAGKSFSVKLTALREMERGVRHYIIDPEGEYVDMALYAGGRVMTPGIPGQGMNPFTIDDLDAEDMNFRIGNLKGVIQMMIAENLNATLGGALDYALTEYYDRARENAEIGERIGFNDFCRYLEEDAENEERRMISAMLRPFSVGSLRNLLTDEGEDLLLNEPMITVFDLHLVEKQMQAVAAMICTDTVWAMAARDPRRRRLIVDEVWSIIRHEAGAEFMLNVAKRARKHLFGVTSITQDVHDLLTQGTHGGLTDNSGRALLQNASLKILLKQDAAAVGSIGETFSLPTEVSRSLVSKPIGRGILVSSETHIPIVIEATAEEAKIVEWVSGRDRGMFGEAAD